MTPDSEAIIRAVIARMERKGMGSWTEVAMLRKALPAEADSAYAEENADILESRIRARIADLRQMAADPDVFARAVRALVDDAVKGKL